MSFLYPWVLSFLIPLGLLFIYKKKFSPPSHPFHPKITLNSPQKLFWLTPLILAFLIIALARPILQKPSSIQRATTPLWIAIDFSDSMLAQDIKPNRLQAALAKAKELIQKAKEPIGIIIFTSKPLIIAPPTYDKEMLRVALNSIKKEAILTHSTNFEALLELVGSFEGKKNLVIFSDGGEFNHLKLPKDTTIYAVLVATKTGALIPADNGFLKDKGHLVVSRLNPNFITLAKSSGGTALNLDEAQKIAHIASKEETKGISQIETIELFPIPLALAILLFLYQQTTLLNRLRRFLPLILLLYINLHASIFEELQIKRAYAAYKNQKYQKAAKLFKTLPYFEAQYGLALSLIKLGKYPEAIKILKSLKSSNPKIKAKIFFLEGVAFEKLKKFDAAREACVKAANLNPTSKILQCIERLAFLHNEKKQSLPFAKQKHTQAKETKKGSKSGGASNMQLSATAAASNRGKHKKSQQNGIARNKSVPISSSLYDLINKGYIYETHPW